MNGNAEKSNGNVWLTGEDFIVAVAHGDYFQTNLSYAAAVQIDTVRGPLRSGRSDDCCEMVRGC